MQRSETFFPGDPTFRNAMLHAAHPPPQEDRAILGNGDEAVRLGSVVVFRDLRSDELEEYTLVHPDQADILENRISTFTPIGQAIFGRRVGEVVEFDGPSGPVRIRIESICSPIEAHSAPRH